MQSETVYVVGHKNPDTDSICSAIAYADLRRQQGERHFQPARAGNINKQTEFVLDQIGVEMPPLLTDVHPRVRDVVQGELAAVPQDAPLAEALELFHRRNVRMLPVIDDNRRPLGILVMKRLSEHFLVSGRGEELRRTLASPASICRCLQGRFLCETDVDAVEELHLYVGAMAAETFREKMENRDPRRLILVTGDRETILRQAIERRMRVLIVTGDLPVAEDLVDMARSKGVCLISTSFDTATTTWLTRLSTPVSRLVSGDCPSIGLDETLEELRLKLMHSGEPGVAVLDGDGRISAVATKSNLLQPLPFKLVLVDHNELTQAVPGAERVEILEVIDHHRLGNPHTDRPIRFVVQPLGSTCTVVASLYRQAGLTPDRITAGLLAAGILSDTVLLKSPTTTDTDRQMLPWLSDLAGLDSEEFGHRMFAAGSALGTYASPRDLLMADFKEYEAGETSFGIGQVEVIGFQEFHAMRTDLGESLMALRQERKLGMAGLLVTDIVAEDSLLLAVGNPELPYIIGYPQKAAHIYELKGVLSRKKQLVPHLLKVFRQ